MKPRFALNLSPDGLSLLHRAKGGWNLVGEVALDTPDLKQALQVLRATASALEGGGVSSKLIIPGSQVLYTTLPLTALSDEGRADEIRQGLTGLTPYAVDDLVFDWHATGGEAKVAVVARETLDEAEAFATEHRFNPVSFVALPDAGQFPREPWFGATKAAPGLLPAGETIEQDTTPVLVIGRVARPEEQAKTPTPPRETPPPPAAFDDMAGDAGPAADDAEPQAAPEAATFSTSRAAAPAPVAAAEAPALAPPGRLTLSAGDPPRVTPLDMAARNAGITAPDAPFSDVAADLEPARADTPPAPEPPAPRPKRGRSQKKSGRKAAMPKVEIAPARATVTTPIAPPPANEAAALTVFGARPGSEEPAKRSPVPMALALTAILLLVIGAVALWSSVLSSRSTSDLATEAPMAELAIALPDDDPVAPQAAAVPPAPRPERPAETPGEAAIAPPAEAPVTAAQTTPEVVPAPLPPAPAGIWPQPPARPEAPRSDGYDELYLASIDPAVSIFDAVALPDAADIARDTDLPVPALPAAPGRTFALDETTGLVTPTPEGTLNPDGILVFAGRPALTPPRTDRRPPETAQAPDAALAGFRPRSRPENLVERNERSRFAGRTRDELGELRPQPRPASVQEQALAETDSDLETEPEARASDSPLAVAASPLPAARPKDFSDAVARALSEAAKSDVASASDEPEATSVRLSIPTTASVAKQATIANAINLKEINLIGVYGSASDRRALVRLPSGRYLKVKVGDKVDGGRVAAISDSELRYVKSGRNITLEMPQG